MYDAVTSNLLIREWLNGSLLPLSLNLAIIIAVFLWDSWIEAREGNLNWWTMSGVPTGCALFWIFILDGTRAGSVWIILRITNDGVPVPQWVRDYSTVALIVAALGLAITMLRCTFLFTPPRWGNAYWIYSVVSTVLFLIVSHLFPTFI